MMEKTAKTRRVQRTKSERALRRAYIQMNRLIECGGALAESVLFLLREERVDDPSTVDILKTHVANWDAAVLAVPEEWIG